ncbi:MAG: hypothetical protein MUF01_01760 [Bryobacterales bacterium]|nr:hypothetical protein [Bryobacterales bacterium]
MMSRITRMLPVVFALMVALAPAAFGQDGGSGEESNPMTQYILGGLAVLVIFLYIKRRGKRKSASE